MQSRVPATPVTRLFKAPFSGRFFPYAYMRRQQVSQQVGKRGNRRLPCFSSCVFPMAAAPASKYAHASVLAFRRRGDSRGIQATGSCSCTAHSCAPVDEAAVEKSTRRDPAVHSGSTQEVASGGWGMKGGILYICRSPSPRRFCYIYLIPFVSHLIAPSFIYLSPPSLLYLCDHPHTPSLTIYPPTQLCSLTLS